MSATESPSKRTGRNLNLPGIPASHHGIQELLDDAELFHRKPLDEQRIKVDEIWSDLAYVLPKRALRTALTATKKEAGQVQQFVTAAAIAKDKRFPASDDALTIRIPAKMLSSYSCAIVLKPTLAHENAQSVTHVSAKS